MNHNRRLILWMCVGQIGALLPLSTIAALLPQFSSLWGLSNTEAGFLAGSINMGYMAAVPFLMALTDRLDARLVLMGGAAMAVMAAMGFGFFADGLWSGLFWRVLSGVGLAGTYMPGLRALTDRMSGDEPSRGIATYTASYAIGAGLSFLYGGEVSELVGWRAMSVLAGVGPLIPLLIGVFVLRPKTPIRVGAPSVLLNFRPVFRNRAAMGYVLGYTAHCYELAAARIWTVAFMVFVLSRQSDVPAFLSPALVATVLTLVGLPASIFGNEYAIRLGRRKSLTWIMGLSAVTAVLVGVFSTGPLWLVLGLLFIYAVTLTADSGALTAGTIAAAEPAIKGATMALHSLFGFAVSAVAPLIFGLVLDIYGGRDQALAWAAAFALNGAVVLLGPWALYRLARTEA